MKTVSLHPDCSLCQRITDLINGTYPAVIQEFTHSWLVLGDHQYYKGYCLLIYKEHVRELHELSAEISAALYSELMTATQAVAAAFQPYKINHCCLGNVDEHIHWHIIPRTADEPDFPCHPWKHEDKFGYFKPDFIEQQVIIKIIRRYLG